MSRLSDALDRVSEQADDGTLPAPPVLVFVIPGDPVAKGRPRVSTAGGFAGAFTPKRTRVYESIVREAAVQAVADAGGTWPLAGPIRVELRAVFRRPGRLFRRKDPDGAVLHDRRPDLDNVIKAVLDGMDGAGVWQDDAQVAEIGARKVYGGIVGDRRDKVSGAPHVVVRVWTMSNQNGGEG